MAQYVKGDVLWVDFPFSDLTDSKERPAFVVNPCGGEDYLLCQITSQPYGDDNTISITPADFHWGRLPIDLRYIRPKVLFTANQDLILGRKGRLKSSVSASVIQAIVAFVSG